MAATGPGRRALAASLLGALVSAGCGAPGGDPPPPVPEVSPTLGVIDPVRATAAEPPTEPQEYAEVAVGAWAAPQLSRLAMLTTPEVYQRIIDLPGPPDLGWRSIRCDDRAGDDRADDRTDDQADDSGGRADDQAGGGRAGDPADDRAGGGRSDCSFTNTDGDLLVLTIDHALLGEPGAVVAVSFDPIDFPEDPAAYVSAFVDAWDGGNRTRMARLATSDVVAVWARLAPEPDAAVTPAPPADGPMVTVVVTLTDTEVAHQVDSSRLGGPQAIRAATSDPE